MLAQKDKMIEEMRNMLRLVESEKRQMIESNTKMLVELNQGLEFSRGEKGSDQKDNSYKELLKMYQFLIEENN
jgi:16S rRNA A1518/A1519 N6-dimethyltransferase RsmA/KsgA/DIM1 with predicted DNA glycosylase/AP lyase activity